MMTMQWWCLGHNLDIFINGHQLVHLVLQCLNTVVHRTDSLGNDNYHYDHDMMEIIIHHNDNCNSYEDNHGPLRDDNFHDNNHDSQLSHS